MAKNNSKNRTKITRLSAKSSLSSSDNCHEIQGVFFIALALFLFLSLVSYHSMDSSGNTGSSGEIQNFGGSMGAQLSDWLLQFFGYGAFLIPLMLVYRGILKFKPTPQNSSTSHLLGFLLLLLCFCSFLSLLNLDHPDSNRGFLMGGVFGQLASQIFLPFFSTLGTLILVLTGLSVAIVLVFPASLLDALVKLGTRLIRYSVTPVEPPPSQEINILDLKSSDIKPKKKELKKQSLVKRGIQKLSETLSGKSGEVEPGYVRSNHGYQYPPLSILESQPQTLQPELRRDLVHNSQVLEEKLWNFGVEGQVTRVSPGPVITRYEFQPASGVKINKIVNLADDLALALKAMSVRIVAPIPGKDVVGIEVPNAKREIVYLKDILTSKEFRESKSKLTLALGKDTAGVPYVADLAKMPHLLIAGATGSGKSVCLNALICSLLFNASPEEIRFILIDPKMLELGIYDDIPHLLTPVVTNPKKAASALNWATLEMERRYRVLARKGVRHIDQYNQAIDQAETPGRPPLLFGRDKERGEERLPYLVIVIDELADLMITSAAEVEGPITRLAQMARAVGIHLILATQRPSVDVITGVIKANFPARISFRVSSKVDSRTILDTNGAEKLLGDGDMLFLLPGTSRIKRIHGSYVSEKEIKKLTTFLKAQGPPRYDHSILTQKTQGETEEITDDIYEKAVRLVVTSGIASISMLQRKLKVGHSRASRLIDMMEADGIVGPFEGSKPRAILMTPEQLIARFGEDKSSGSDEF